MTPEQIATVQRTFAELGADRDRLSERFYARLFERDSALRELFPDDLAAQRVKFRDELGAIVRSIGDLSGFVPRVRRLGDRHSGYGVRAAHYALVGRSLLDALGDVLGDRFTAPVRDAWAQAYDLVAETMMHGAATGSASRSS